MPREPRLSGYSFDTSPRTAARRGPPPPLTSKEILMAKHLRDLGWSFEAIAGFLPSRPSPEDVRLALAPTRSRHANPRRKLVGFPPEWLPRFNSFAPHPDAKMPATLAALMDWGEIGKMAVAAGFRPFKPLV